MKVLGRIAFSTFLVVMGALIICGFLWFYDAYPVQSFRVYQYFLVLGCLCSLYMILTWVSSGQCFAVSAANISPSTPIETLHKEIQDIKGRLQHIIPNVLMMRNAQGLAAGIVIGRNMIVHEVTSEIYTSSILAAIGMLLISRTLILHGKKIASVTEPSTNNEIANGAVFSHITNNALINAIFLASFYLCFIGK